MHTYFISDLHLQKQTPQTIQAFIYFLTKQAPTAERIYLLGDLFEFWIGDDAAPMLGAEPILGAMQALASQVDCYFIAGNRDFLVGEQFSQQSGFKILDDETVIDLYGTATLILHGDSLCTEDIAHQQFRKQIVTNKEWREGFLTLSIAERIEQAKLARMESNQHKSEVTMDIMDVTETAVIDAFTNNGVKNMIHGHTHRQNIHQYELQNNEKATRYVLGDWHTSASVLIAKDDGTLTIDNFPI